MFSLEEKEEAIFSMISHAGEARGEIFQAITHAEVGNLAAATESYTRVAEHINNAHKLQTRFLQDVDSEEQQMHVLLIHAQDHLMTALSERALGERILNLHKKVASLEERLAKLEGK